MKTIGKRIVCDRCGEELFLKYTGTETLDGGYTPIEKFEKIPDNWELGYPMSGARYVDLCPRCAAKLKTLLNNFLSPEPVVMNAAAESDRYYKIKNDLLPIFDTREDANKVLNALIEEYNDYGRVPIMSLFDRIGEKVPSGQQLIYTNYGWNDLHDVKIKTTLSGNFYIDFPEAIKLI